jgi:hypothetical protein
MSNEPVLTRYLFNKDTVIQQLKLSIYERDYKGSLFWAYELYFSWYEQEVINFLIDILHKAFPHYKFLNEFLNDYYCQWKEADIVNKPHQFIATIIRNLLVRNPKVPENKKQALFEIIEEDIIEYYTTQINLLKPLDIPAIKEDTRNVNEAKKIPKINSESVPDFCDNWLYYASRNHLWKYRILQYKGTIDINTRKVEFSNIWNREQFFEAFGYNMKDFPKEIHRRCFILEKA